MRLADLMIISSRREGFPLVLAEMLQLQRPLVSTRVAGVEEILPAEWMCEPEDSTGLAVLINKALIRLPQLSQEFAPIFKLAAEELRIESAARKTEAIYREARQESDRR
jgi:glycosyltransferase involved in cell wall biosynthesis